MIRACSSKTGPWWTQKSNYDLPEFDQIKTHKARLLNSYKNHSNLLWTIIAAYKFETFMLLIVQILTFIFSGYSSKVSSEYLAKLSNLAMYHDKEALIDVGASFMFATFLNLFNSVVSDYLSFYSLRLSIAIRSALFSIIQDKIMKFNILNSSEISPGLITDVIRIDVVYMNDIYLTIFSQLGNLIGLFIGIAFFWYYLGLTLLGFVLLRFLITFIFLYIFYRLQAYLRNKYLKAKDERMSLLRNVLDNIDFVKTNALENYFCLEMFDKRESEIYWLWLQGLLHSVKFGYDDLKGQFIPTMFYRLVWINFPGLGMTLQKYYQFGNLSGSVIGSLDGLGLGYSAYLKYMVSIRRIDKFLKAPEIQIRDEELPEDEKTAIKIVNGRFKWRHKNSEEEKSKTRLGIRGGRREIGSPDTDGLLSEVGTVSESAEAEFGGSENNDFILRNVNVSIEKGAKVAVIGGSNSGMSSLLYAILGEMIPVDNTKVYKAGSVSYLSQTRWLMGSSIKENITMGKTYDPELMTLALEAADLLKDLDQFTDGLETILSDGGTNVSGGQRARIALARCFYQDSDNLLLDDPTSSLDNKVSADIFNIINNHPRWNKKTFIISTKKLNVLDYVDQVIFMKKGRILYSGNKQGLKNLKEFEELKKFQEKKENEKQEKTLDEINAIVDTEELEQQKEEAKLGEYAKESQEEEVEELGATRRRTTEFFIQEDKKEGTISPRLFHKIIKGTFGYIWAVCFLIIIYVSSQAEVKSVGLDYAWVLEFFNKDHPVNNKKLTSEYTFYQIIQAVADIVSALPAYWSLRWFARSLHANMFFSLLHSQPTSFLQRTSKGIILNRFSNDVSNVEQNLIFSMLTILGSSSSTIAWFFAIISGISSYAAFVPLLLFAVVTYRTRNRFMDATREASRLNKISKSPVVGTSVSSISGGAVIRALGCQDYLQKKFDHDMEENAKNMIMLQGLSYWFSVQMTLMKSLLLTVPLTSMTIWAHYSTKKPNKNVAAFLSYISEFGGTYWGILLHFSNVETNLISVERLDQYERLPSEPGYLKIEKDSSLFKDLKKRDLVKARQVVNRDIENLGRSASHLFTQGRVTLMDVNARYPSAQNDVMRGIDLEILPGQTVGIVGRTGAGKSSFTKMLWRALDPYQGAIEIDGIDISSIDSKELRKQLNIVLQKPSVFEGTILSNISRHPIPADRVALIREEMIDLGFPRDKLEERDLSYGVKESGSNLSQSEKQIICLMQSLERRDSKVVILDEATAYVDLTMEKKFQDKIGTAFKDCTVFIIAHKISNVMDADRILVFDKGRVIQDGSPKELTEDTTGAFYQIWSKR